jgi:hypothetical protein
VGLAPGSQYRLVFVAADFYTAESSNIADYNNDVNTEANSVSALAALGTTWLDIGSTATVNAIDNIGIDSGVPIYGLDGNLVANDAGTEAGGLFGGTIKNRIAMTEFGGYSPWSGPNYVWTSSGPWGETLSGAPPFGATDSVAFGDDFYSDGEWINAWHYPPSLDFSLYGISAVLTAPTPEPSTMGMALVAGALLYVAWRIKRTAGPLRRIPF